MDTTKATAASVEAARMKAGLSRLELSKASGIPRPTLYRSLDGFRAFNVDELDRIAAALDVHPTTLVRFRAVAS